MSAIDRDDCYFEEVTEDQLESSGAKKYVASGPLELCSCCEEKDCKECAKKAEKIAEKLYSEYFADGDADEKSVSAALKAVSDFIQKNIGAKPEKKLIVCTKIQLMQKIDEESELDVDDGMVEGAVGIYGEFSK